MDLQDASTTVKYLIRTVTADTPPHSMPFLPTEASR
jgi:hypothetical protein